MEKYREITSKSNSDNISKPQQYLDGLLSIPFGLYQKEDIIKYLCIFKNGISNYILNYINNTCKGNILDKDNNNTKYT